MPADAEAPDSIAKRLEALASERIGDRRVADVRIGLRYTAVALEDGGLGLALTFLDGWERSCRALDPGSCLVGEPGVDLLPGLSSDMPVEAALGLACVNAVFNRPGVGRPGDVLERVAPRPEDRVVMVGHFMPIQRRLQGAVASLEVFERKAERAEGVRPADEVFAALPGADVALITATSLLNHSLEPILEAAEGCRQVALLGASTPLVPEAFAHTPVSLLSGVTVSQGDAVMRTVSAGGGMAAFKQYVQKTNLVLARP